VGCAYGVAFGLPNSVGDWRMVPVRNGSRGSRSSRERFWGVVFFGVGGGGGGLFDTAGADFVAAPFFLC